MASILTRRMAGLRLHNMKDCGRKTTLDTINNVPELTKTRFFSNLYERRNNALTSLLTSESIFQTQRMRITSPNLRSNKFSTSVLVKDGNMQPDDGIHTMSDILKSYSFLPQTFGRNSGIKLKPRVVKNRLLGMKTYNANEKAIRHSPWRMNLVCQFAAGLPVKEALVQLQFCQKVKAPLLATLIERTAKRAEFKDGLKMSQLEVAECFATHGTHLKRIKFMGRGRTGIKRRRHSNIRLVLREIDFDLKILQAKSMNERKEWIVKKLVAKEDRKIADAEREELLALEKAAKQKKEKEKKND